ncbi:TetR/AcrR family transcriptional regulator [Microbacterium sp. cf332]|uniref:TetR/AcrR family transcriptional regulator n=1 Tax=Microbacterium sp. cf332 TaxID=1761804 RepID=UPI00087FDB07|nr:TetR/AcrR family transcriptional regulator [Microbacterium sp. cf332]SDQ62681.1 transcriptional regulator, TetR family [Microbacterium sp. cf332]
MTTATPPTGGADGARGDRDTRGARARQTRERIVASARTLFVAQGYRATSMRDVAAGAGISHTGLLKHVASKDELLAAVVAALEAENAALDRVGAGAALPFAALAAHNEQVPGYLELFAALSGEACARTHPAHRSMATRYDRIRDLASRSLEAGIASGVVARERDVRGESVRITAAWDGLQVLRLYLPGRIDVASMLASHSASLGRAPGRRTSGGGARRPDAAARGGRENVPAAPQIDAATRDAPDDGYRVGRERRERIVADAIALFARQGYVETSLRDIAAAVGASKSTLLHHYPTKADLLRAVMVARDERVSATVGSGSAPGDGAARLRALPAAAARDARDEPGLIEVYAVLSCEAIPADHPAHTHFRDRFDRSIDEFAALFRAAQADGILSSHRDPVAEAVWLLALWDGLQYQWLYDPEAVDVAAHLRAHLADVLP